MKVQKALVLGLVVLAGCGDEEDDLRCVFRGRYEYGFLPITANCPSLSFQLPFYDDEESCFQQGTDITPTGITFDATSSCTPGDPVGECEGFANFSNGCSYTAYVRRLAQ